VADTPALDQPLASLARVHVRLIILLPDEGEPDEQEWRRAVADTRLPHRGADPVRDVDELFAVVCFESNDPSGNGRSNRRWASRGV